MDAKKNFEIFFYSPTQRKLFVITNGPAPYGSTTWRTINNNVINLWQRRRRRRRRRRSCVTRWTSCVTESSRRADRTTFDGWMGIARVDTASGLTAWRSRGAHERFAQTHIHRHATRTPHERHTTRAHAMCIRSDRLISYDSVAGPVGERDERERDSDSRNAADRNRENKTQD